MSQKTNMNQIKRAAMSLLDMPIQEDKYGIAHHPFTNSIYWGYSDKNGIHQIGKLLKGTKPYKAWRKQYVEIISSAKCIYDIWFWINKPWMLIVLKEIKNYLSVEDFARLLMDSYIEMEAPNLDGVVSKTQLNTWFSKCKPRWLMSQREMEKLNSFPETIKVYRGVTDYNSSDIRALSWTVDFDQAEWFAKRFGNKGYIYSASIDKKNIHAYTDARSEKEVIVNPDYLVDIQLVKEIGIQEKCA